MSQNVEIRVSANTQDAEASVRKLEQSLNKLSQIERKGQTSDGNFNKKDLDSFKKATEDFQSTYSNYVGTMKSQMSDLKNQISEFNQELNKATSNGDERSRAACQDQINYLKAHHDMLKNSLQTAADMQRIQQQQVSNISYMHNGTPGVSYGGSSPNLPLAPPPPPRDLVPTSYGEPPMLPPGVPGGSEPGGTGGKGSLLNLLNGGTAFFAARKAYRYLGGAYSKMDTDEADAWRLAQKTGQYGSDFTSARKDIENTGIRNGYNLTETNQSALTYARTGGVKDVQKNLQDVESMQRFSRAYATDPTQMAAVGGMLNKIGATNEGEQRKFAQMLAESIKEQGMSGREAELVQATSSLAQNLANNKLSVTGGDLNNIMAFQNAISSLSPQLKGQQGANAIQSFDDNIHNAGNNLEILMGRGTDFVGPSGVWQLQKQKEKGVSDPRNIARIFKNAKRFGNFRDNEQAASHVKMIISEATGWKTDMVDKIIDNPNLYEKFASGKFSDDEMKSLTTGTGDMENKAEDFDHSGVARRKKFRTNKDNVQKRFGDSVDTIVSPFQQAFNGMPMIGKAVSVGLAGTAGVALSRQGLKLGMQGVKSTLGGAGAKAGFGAVAGKSAQAAGSWLGKGLTAVGSHAPVVGGAFSGVYEYLNSKADGESTGKAVAKGAGGAAGGALGAWGGAELGATIGTAFAPGIGTVIGGGLGMLGGWIGGHAGGKVAGSIYDSATHKSSTDAILANPNNPNNPNAQKRKQQTKEEQLLDKESDIVRRREELQRKNGETLEKAQHTSKVNESAFWNDGVPGAQQNASGGTEKKGIFGKVWDWLKDKTKGLFGGGSESGGSEEGGSNAGDAKAYAAGPKLGGTIGQLSRRTTKSLGKAPTAKQLDDWIAKNAPKGSLMRGTGAMWLEASKQSGLDVGYLIAHAAQETGWGTSNILKKKNNWFGIGAFNASPGKSAYTFGGKQAGIVNGAKWIARNYANKGQDSLSKMIYGKKDHAYATYDNGAPNDDWMKSIAKIWSGAPKYAIGNKSISHDQLAVVHQGEKITPAMENPDNAQSPFAFLSKHSQQSDASSSSTGTKGEFTININLGGHIDGMNPKNQGQIATSIAGVLNRTNNLAELLQKGIKREAY